MVQRSRDSVKTGEVESDFEVFLAERHAAAEAFVNGDSGPLVAIRGADGEGVFFEPSGEVLWLKIRTQLERLLGDFYAAGAFLGATANEAYSVRCDATTTSQNDLDNGRLICLIGVAPLRPAEFVIFRIGQWTADRKI